MYGSWVKSSNGGVRQIGRIADLGAGSAGGRSLSAKDGANPSLRAVSPLYGGFVVYGSWVKSSNGGVRQIGRIADLGVGSAGGVGTPTADLCEFLAKHPQSPVIRFTMENTPRDAVFDIRAVFQQHHADLDIESMPRLLLPVKGRYGLIDYEKIFSSKTRSGDDVYAMRGISVPRGCMVVVRPGQYVAQVLPLDAHDALTEFFDGFMLAR